MTLKPIWYTSHESLLHILILLNQYRDKLDLAEILATAQGQGKDILVPFFFFLNKLYTREVWGTTIFSGLVLRFLNPAVFKK